MNISRRFMTGACHLLAYEVSKYLPQNYQLVITTGCGGHAYVIDCDGFGYDADGKHTEKELLDKWHINPEDPDDEIIHYQNNIEGRREFLNDAGWFFEDISENPDKETAEASKELLKIIEVKK